MLHALSNRVLFAGAVGVVLVLVLIPFVGERDKKPARVPVDDEREAPPGSWRAKVGQVAWHWNDAWGRIAWPIPDDKAITNNMKKRGGEWFVGPYEITVCDQAGRAYHVSGEWMPLQCDAKGKPWTISLRYAPAVDAEAPAGTVAWRCCKDGGGIPPLLSSDGQPYDPKGNRPDSVRVFISGKMACIWTDPAW